MKPTDSPKCRFDSARVLFHDSEVWKWLNGLKFPPICLELDLTLFCNDGCNHCTYKFAHQSRYLPTTKVLSMLKQAKDIGISGLTLTGGGEPLSHPGIHEILKLIRNSPFKAGLFSNGGRITSLPFANELIRTFNLIRISLNSFSREKFLSLRGHDGFETRIKALEMLTIARRAQSNPTCDLGINFLTSKFNCTDIFPAALGIKSMGFDYIRFRPMTNYNEGNRTFFPSLYSQKGVLHEVKKAALELSDNGFNVFFSESQYEDDIELVSVQYSAFHMAWFVISVGPSVFDSVGNPTLYLDCSNKYLPEWTIGEFSNLQDILNSDTRLHVINQASSDVFCVPSDRHARTNHVLESLLQRHALESLSRSELAKMRNISAWTPWNL